MSDIPPPPPGFTVDPPSKRKRGAAVDNSAPPPIGDDIIVRPLDGDTLRLRSGRDLRLWGIDAPESRQQGWDRNGNPVPIGQEATGTLADLVNMGTPTFGAPVGTSYGRTVGPLDVGGNDVGLSMLNRGEAYAEPNYITGDPQRRYDYVQAERLARQNFQGVHRTYNRPPAEFRQNPSYQPSRDEVAQFWDTPTPDAGLTADVEKGYLDVATHGTARDIMDYADAHGFKVNPGEVASFVANRNKGVGVEQQVYYRDAPKPLTNPGDGRTGSGARGLSNGVLFNQLEELGAGVDTLGLTPGRENVFNSDRRLADIYSNNLSQNEAITGYDQAFHPYVYHGSELAGSFVVPMARVRSAADLAKWGAAYGGLSGLGQPGTIPERLTSGVVGAGAGAATTILGTRALEAATPVVSRWLGKKGEMAADAAVGVAEGLSDDIPPPPDGFAVNGPDGRPARVPDRIDVGPSAPAPEAPREPINSANPGPVPGKPPSLDDVTGDVQRWAREQGVGSDGMMLHGSSKPNIEQFDPYQYSNYGLFGQGTYLTDNPGVALGYSGRGSKGQTEGRSIYSVRQTVSNPLDLDGPIDLNRWGKLADEYGLELHRDMKNADAYKALEDAVAEQMVPKWEGAEIMSDAVRSMGHDGLTHIGGGRFGAGDGPRHRVVIALDPEQTDIVGRYDVGERMQPPLRDRSWIDINDIPPPPPGFRINPPGNDNQQIASTLEEVRLMSRRPMAQDAEPTASVSQGMRRPDYLDMGGGAQARRLTDPLTQQQMERVANDIQPRDLLPIPSNEVGSVEEAAAKDAGRYVEAKPVDENTALSSRTVTSQNGRELKKRGPLDLVTWLRSQGGIRDQGGDLRAMGIDNAPRDMDLARGEQRLGKLVNDQGMSLDDAAMKAWEAGYLPGNERPDINTLLDAIDKTHSGADRYFHPDDLHEVEQYHGMRQDRQALEARLADGPAHVDRSVPAGPDQPFAPPEAHEDWPSGGPDFAGNIRLEKLNTPQDIKRAMVTTERRVGFDAATRGKVTQAETERLASELGMTPDQLLSRRKGQAFNAEEALAARQILAKSANELVNLAKRVQSLDEPGDELLGQFRQAWMRHTAIQEQIAGATAEAGRALAQFRMVADSRAVRKDVLAGFINGGGGRERLQEAAETLLEAVETEPGKFNVLANKLAKVRFRDKAIELYYNFLLSRPATHMVNVVSNTLTALGQLPEHAAAGVIGAARQALPKANIDRVTGSEVGARAFGLMQGFKEGLPQFIRTARTGETSDLVSKVEAQAQEAIPGMLGKVIRTPSRLLSAEDEMFKAVARRMELNGLAVRMAHTEGLKGDAAARRIAELTANPTDDMLAKSLDYGRYLTFQRPLGNIAGSIQRMRQNSLGMTALIPFVRTPTNLLKFAAERSPAAPLLKEWRKDFAAGGARRDLAIARSLVGTAFGAAVYEAALDGRITGSRPLDPAKARFMNADGWQPYSIRVGDKYYSYSRLDPFSTTIGVAADLATKREGMTDRQVDDYATMLTASIIKNMGDKTWLSSASDFVQAINDWPRYGQGYLRKMAAGAAVPALSAGVAQAVDPTSRDVRTVGDAIQARIPGLSDNLPARRDIWGEPIVNEGGVGPDILSPVWQSTAKNDPVNAEMLRIGAKFDTPDRYITRGRKRIDLTPQQYERYSELAGRRTRANIEALMANPDWKGLTSDQKAARVKKAAMAGKADARAQLFGDSSSGSKSLGDSPPPPPAGYSITGEAGGRNVYADLLRTIPGLTEDNMTSGFRTPAYQEDMKRRGYHPADNSGHLDGSSFDITVPAGRSMGWLIAQVKRYDPKARLLPEGDHLHATFPGYYGAPALGGARGAGLANPLAGMPPPPAGFTVNAR